MLTGEEIVTALGKHIIIYPFDRQALAGTTYNLRVGRFAWLHDPSPSRAVHGSLDRLTR